MSPLPFRVLEITITGEPKMTFAQRAWHRSASVFCRIIALQSSTAGQSRNKPLATRSTALLDYFKRAPNNRRMASVSDTFVFEMEGSQMPLRHANKQQFPAADGHGFTPHAAV